MEKLSSMKPVPGAKKIGDHWSIVSVNCLIGKDPDAGKVWRQEEKGMVEDEMVGWHHQLKVSLSVSQLWEFVKDREAWHSAVHGVTKSWTWLSNWTDWLWKTFIELRSLGCALFLIRDSLSKGISKSSIFQSQDSFFLNVNTLHTHRHTTDMLGIKITRNKVKPKTPIAATFNQVVEGMVLVVFKRHILW